MAALDAAIHALLFQSPQKGLRLLLIQPKTIMRSHFLPAGAIAVWFAMNQFNRRQIPLSPV